MKPKITFQQNDGRLILLNSREFHEVPPINQELTLRDERYKVVSYDSVTINVEPVIEQERAPRSAKSKQKAKRAAKVQRKQAHTAKKASKGKTTSDGKSEATAVKGNFYNRKGN